MKPLTDNSEPPLGVSQTKLTTPGGDRIVFWDDSAGGLVWLDLGANLSISDTTLSATGGGGTYELYKAKANFGSLTTNSFDDLEQVIPWNNFAISGGSSISLSGTPQSVIDIATTGTYKFTVTFRTDNANRTELFIRTYINTGSGLVQDADEIVSDYVSRDADQDTGSVTLATALALTAGHSVEFRGFGDTDGTCIGLDPGSTLIVERVA